MEKDEGSVVSTLLNHEFSEWRNSSSEDDKIVLLDIVHKPDGEAVVKLLVLGEHEVSLICPSDYPNHEKNIFVNLDSRGVGISLWCNELNEFILDSSKRLNFSDILSQAMKLQISTKMDTSGEGDLSDTDESIDSNCEEEDGAFDVDPECSDDTFTTAFELEICKKKKRWLAKQKIVKKEALMNSTIQSQKHQDGEKSITNPIFSENASSGILINDLASVIKTQKETGISADPIEDNIYTLAVRISNFSPESDLANDLAEVAQRYDYDYIQLELMFPITVYPFYPPLITVIRPLMKNSLMQRISNLEIIKLSYWDPAKDLKSVLTEIKAFMQEWSYFMDEIENGRPLFINVMQTLEIEVDSERNDPKLFPDGSYLHIEHHLLRLAQTSESSPRANLCYSIKEEKLPKRLKTCKKTPVGKWKEGTGYGTYARRGSRKEWDVNAYVAAQREKDKQIENVLLLILEELKRMLRSDNKNKEATERLYEILEGSCLLPFVKTNLYTDSILEISKHTVIFKKIFQIIEIIASCGTLVNLLGPLPEDNYSAFGLLMKLQERASEMLRRLSSACSTSQSEDHIFAETIIKSYIRVKEYVEMSEFKNEIMASLNDGKAKKDSISTLEEALYAQRLKPLQFLAVNIPVTGTNAHHFLSKSNNSSNKKQVLRIAQELSSLTNSLPLNRSSSVFVRTDDNNISLMQALITGPEGSPYSGGCFLFDILFPHDYPSKPPKVNLQTTGRQTVRFNPNLYASGKVCLSLLGTWEGQQGEKWNAETSTILQVLVSIQSLILVPEPFFNEPGYERQIGTPEGEIKSREYNLDVVINNVRFAMLEQIRSPPHGFEDVIKRHFFLKKDQILRECREWLDTDFVILSKKTPMESVCRELRTQLESLVDPDDGQAQGNSLG